MLDVFLMIEAYCHLLIERIALFQNKECPDELKEAVSSLIFATSRCGGFPELQQIREMFVSRFGKEFAARAAELQNNCGVNLKMIQRLSTRQASLESRLKVLTEIASENGITLSLEEDAALSTEEKQDVNQKQKRKQLESNESANLDNPELKDDNNDFPELINCGETLSESVKARKYRDVASAAQDAFKSAAYAAAAARAAVELSRAESWDQDPDYYSGSKHQRRIMSSSDGSSTSKLQVDTNAFLQDIEKSNDGLGFDMIHPTDNLSSESERDEMEDNLDRSHLQEMKECERKAGMERTLSGSSSDSDGGNLHGSQMSLNIPDWNEQSVKGTAFDGNDNQSEKPQVDTWLKHHDLGSGKKFSFPKNELSKGRQFNAVADEDFSDEDGNNLYYKPPTRILLKSQADSPAYSGEGKSTFESTYSSSSADESHSKHSHIGRKPASLRTRRIRRD